MNDVKNLWEVILPLFLWSYCPLYLNIGYHEAFRGAAQRLTSLPCFSSLLIPAEQREGHMRSNSNLRKAPYMLGKTPDRGGPARRGGLAVARQHLHPRAGTCLPAAHRRFLPRPLPLSGDPVEPGWDPQPQPLRGIWIGGMQERQVAKCRRGVGG